MIVIDPDKCGGCHRCEIICSLGKEEECNPAKSRIKINYKRRNDGDASYMSTT